jgi:hypothetical protein
MADGITDELTPWLKGVMQRQTTVNEVMAAAVVSLFRRHFDDMDRSRPNSLGGKRTHYWGQASDSVHHDNITPDGFDVDVTHVGVRLHWLGGTVRPGVGISFVTGRPTRMLTIPVDAEAHGRRAKEFENLVVLWGRNGPWALAIAPDSAARRRIALQKTKELKAKTTQKSKGGRLLFKPALGSSSVIFGETLKIKKSGEGKERLGEFSGAHRILFRLVRSATIKPDESVLPSDDDIANEASEAAVDYLTSLRSRANRRAQ